MRDTARSAEAERVADGAAKTESGLNWNALAEARAEMLTAWADAAIRGAQHGSRKRLQELVASSS